MKLEQMILGELETNTYLVFTEQNHCAAIDPAADAPLILRRLSERGAQLKLILLTHCHHDHIGAVRELAEQTGARVLMHAADYRLIEHPELFGARYQSKVEGKGFHADQLVEDGDELALDELRFQVLHTPGHSAGGVCYRCQNELFAGDTLFAGTVGRTDLYSGDFAAMLASVKKLTALTGDVNVYPGHGPLTTLEEERRSNPYCNGAYADDGY